MDIMTSLFTVRSGGHEVSHGCQTLIMIYCDVHVILIYVLYVLECDKINMHPYMLPMQVLPVFCVPFQPSAQIGPSQYYH